MDNNPNSIDSPSTDDRETNPDLKTSPTPNNVGPQDNQPDANIAPASTDQVKPPIKKNTGLKLLAVVVIVLIVAGGVFAYVKHKDNQNNAKSKGVVSNLNVAIEGADLGTSFYPNIAAADGSLLLSAQIYDGLVQYENQNQIVPDLASGWSNPNDNSWLFTIKSGIKFHDGNSLTPADVVYSLNLMKNSNSEYAQTFAATLKSIKTVGKNQVEVVTTQPDPVLLNKLAFLYIVDPHVPKGENQSMAGTGAYELKPGTKLTNSHISLVAVNDFHGGQVLTKAVSLTDASSYESMFNGFKDHQFDIAGETPLSYMKQPNSYDFDEQDNSVEFLAFNTTSGPLSNKLVREAIRYAVSGNAIGASLGFKVITIGQMIPPSIPGYNPAIPAYSQDITKAKQLLAQAGYPNGLTLTLSTENDSTAQTPYYVSQLKQAGITIKVDNQANLNDLVNTFAAGQNQITELSYGSGTLDGADVLDSTIVNTNYNNPTFFNLVNQATTTIDPSARLKLLQQAESILNQDIPVVPVYYQNNIYLMDKPYVIHQDLPALYISVYFSKVHL